MNSHTVAAYALLLALAAPAALHAQAADSAAAAPVLPILRASWVSDRQAVRLGDLLTVVVDERTQARERVSQVATGDRNQRAKLNADMDTGSGSASQYRIGADFGMDRRSRDIGEAGREGDLTGVLTVRVTAIEPGGLLRIQGARSVTVDGRKQEIGLEGVIRPQDVSTSNSVLSSRIADAIITYKGKKIGPKSGLFGSLLNLIWP